MVITIVRMCSGFPRCCTRLQCCGSLQFSTLQSLGVEFGRAARREGGVNDLAAVVVEESETQTGMSDQDEDQDVARLQVVVEGKFWPALRPHWKLFRHPIDDQELTKLLPELQFEVLMTLMK